MRNRKAKSRPSCATLTTSNTQALWLSKDENCTGRTYTTVPWSRTRLYLMQYELPMTWPLQDLGLYDAPSSMISLAGEVLPWILPIPLGHSREQRSSTTSRAPCIVFTEVSIPPSKAIKTGNVYNSRYKSNPARTSCVH
jgi:hypothetical protein